MTETVKVRAVRDEETKEPRKVFIDTSGGKLGVIIVAMVFLGLVGSSAAAYLIIGPKAYAMVRSIEAAVSTMMLVRSDINSLQKRVEVADDERTILLKSLILNPSMDVDTARDIAASVYANSAAFGRSPDLTLAIIKVESHFDPDAVSEAGAIGLMQVMPKWNDILGLRGDLHKIDTNIRHGLKILGFYQETHSGNLRMALAAYNMGPTSVRKQVKKGLDPHRNGYADKVLKVYEYLRGI